MTLNKALLSLAGLSVGDGFGQSLFSTDANHLIKFHRLPNGPWYWTDDTHMAISVVEELRLHDWIDQDYLARRMAWRYTTDPGRGYGPGTRQVLERISNGEYFRSVAGSLPNGGSFGSAAAARAIPLGGFYAGFPAKAAREARLVAAITHLHPEALAGAEAVAVAASLAALENHPRGDEFLKEITRYVTDSEVRAGIIRSIDIAPDDLQRAVLEYKEDHTVMSTVPFALWCAAHHPDNFETALWLAVSGIDPRDTVCAIVGGIVALSSGSIPAEWLRRCEPLPISLSTTYLESAFKTRPLNPQMISAVPVVSSESETQTSVLYDSLTGCRNLLSLLNWTNNPEKAKGEAPFSLIAVHLVALWEVNRNDGRSAGDELLRKTARKLSAVSSSPVFRTGGDKFVVVFNNATNTGDMAESLAKAIEVPGCKPARVSVIYFTAGEDINPGHVLASLYTAMSDRFFIENDGTPREFSASEIRKMDDYPWVARDIAGQIMNMGKTVTEMMKLVHTDSISKLPNMKAAGIALESFLDRAKKNEEPLAVLLIDGDNLHQFNKVSYEHGDEAIWLLGNTMKGQLRDTDFIARWRTGDEFLILLPDTGREQAVQICQRLCETVHEASTTWLFRTSISAGIALYPDYGPTTYDLLHAAEQGLITAKANGKNQAVLATLKLKMLQSAGDEQILLPSEHDSSA